MSPCACKGIGGTASGAMGWARGPFAASAELLGSST